MRLRAMGLLALIAAGCGGPVGPATTNTSSAGIRTLGERVAFVEQYVTFRGRYRALDFHVRYQNNGRGAVPGPSEWDIRIVADALPNELALWIPAGITAVPTADTAWLQDVPGSERAAGITEWYPGAGRLVGVDRARSVVAYRAWKN